MNCKEVKDCLNNTFLNLETDSKLEFFKLFDNGTCTEINKFVTDKNEQCGTFTAFGYISGCPVYAYYQDISLNSGAIGLKAIKKIENVYKKAAENGMPVVAVFNSNGMFFNEGMETLNAFGKIISLSNSISGVVPQIAIINGSCIGTAAILASLADIKIMIKGGEFYLTSPEIIKKADNNSTDLKIGSSEFCYLNGLVDFEAKDYAEAVEITKNVFCYLPQNNLSVVYPDLDFTESDIKDNSDVSAVIKSIADSNSFMELNAKYADDLITGFARIGGFTVGIIANNSNDKYLTAKAAKKATGFIRFLDAFSIPVVTLLDLKGFAPLFNTEILGGEKVFAALTQSYSEASTQKITLINGYAIGSAFVSFASVASAADYTLALPCAKIGALEETAAVELLYKEKLLKGENREDLEKEYLQNECNAFKAAESAIVNDIITLEQANKKLAEVLDMLSGKRVNTLNKKHTDMPL